MCAFLVRLVEHVGGTAVVWPSSRAAKASGDVLIADVAGDDELALARQAIEQHAGVPLILITLGALPAEAARLDAVAVLEKPFSLSEFTGALAAAATARAPGS